MESDPHSMTQCASLYLLHSCGHIAWCRQLLLSLVSELSCSNIHCSRFNSTDQSTKTEDADIWEWACNFNQAIKLIWKTSQAAGTSSVFGSLDEFHYCREFNSLIGPILKTNWGSRPLGTSLLFILIRPSSWFGHKWSNWHFFCVWIFRQMSPLNGVILWLDLF